MSDRNTDHANITDKEVIDLLARAYVKDTGNVVVPIGGGLLKTLHANEQRLGLVLRTLRLDRNREMLEKDTANLKHLWKFVDDETKLFEESGAEFNLDMPLGQEESKRQAPPEATTQAERLAESVDAFLSRVRFLSWPDMRENFISREKAVAAAAVEAFRASIGNRVRGALIPLPVEDDDQANWNNAISKALEIIQASSPAKPTP